MTIANGVTSLADQQHIVLEDVSWEFYEHLLREIGNRHIYVTFDDGRLELMSPLPKQELWGAWINRLVELICLERSIPVATLGSTTFRSRPKHKGLEPDTCFYVQNVEAGLRLDGEFNPAVDPPPDLAVEIDVTSRSVPREPIYAALRVRELWRFDTKRLQVLHLLRGKYVPRTQSLAFPFLPTPEFTKFVLRMREKNQLKVLREFRAWVIGLPK